MQIIESILIVTLVTHGIRFAAMPGKILWYVVRPLEWLQNLHISGKRTPKSYLGAFFILIMEPVYTCIYCMSSFWTALLIAVGILEMPLICFPTLAIIAGACGLNFIIGQFLEHFENVKFAK